MNYGNAPTLRVSDHATRGLRSLIRFELQGTGMTAVSSATLRLYVTTNSATCHVHPVNDSWTEMGVTWANAPPFGSVASSAACAAGRWTELDVTSLVNTELAGDQLLSLGLSATGGTGVQITSSENPGGRPELVLIAPACVPSCGGLACGDDGCGGSCGSCGAGELCDALGQCGAAPQWSSQSPGSSQQLQRGSFPRNVGMGYVVGDSATVLKTSDGGATWQSLAIGSTAAFYDVAASSNGEHVVVVGAAGLVFTSSDAGVSWTARSSGVAETLYGLDFSDDLSTGYAVGSNGTILKTTNGGTSWTAQHSGTSASLYDVQVVSTLVGFAAGADGTILKTSNGGATWQALNSGVSSALYALAFSGGETTGTAVGAHGTILKTSDGGANWAAQSSGTSVSLYGASFPLDERVGYVVGNSGTLLKTEDGGAHWLQEPSSSSADLRDVIFPAYFDQGFVLGSGGLIQLRRAPAAANQVFDGKVAALAPPTVLPGTDAASSTLIVANNDGYVIALQPQDNRVLYRPANVSGPVQGRCPVTRPASLSAPAIFVAAQDGYGYAIDAGTGTLLWKTDGDDTLAGAQRLGDMLQAAPVVASSLNRVFFATRNVVAENRVFAFAADTGACLWAFNGDCSGSNTAGREVGQLSQAPLHDSSRRVLYLSTVKYGSGTCSGPDYKGCTIFAVRADDSAGGTLLWARDIGASDAAPAFADLTLGALYAPTNDGRLYKLDTGDGSSCWGAEGDGCEGAATGAEEAFCTNTGARAASCPTGSAITTGLFVLWTGPYAGGTVFATADGFLQLVDANGLRIWRSSAAIPGASFPVLLPQIDRLYVGSSDGHLYELALSSGAIVHAQVVGDGSQMVGSPTYNNRSTQLHVGTSSGQVFTFSVPLGGG